MRRKLGLADVTLCAADCVHPLLAARALEKCLSAADFGDAILFSDQAVGGSFRWQKIPALGSTAAYSRFCLREMAQYIATPFVLVVQWDGYIVNPAVWTDSFLDFDYIGAPWPDGVVGNGGFSLRSRRLLDALQSVPPMTGLPEDRVVCRIARERLEAGHGIRFAPKALAARFSYETVPAKTQPFGFHGFHNLPKHESDEEVLTIAQGQTPAERATWPYLFAAVDCLRDGREDLAVSLFGLARGRIGIARVRAIVAAGPTRIPFVQAGIARLERMLAARVAKFRRMKPGEA